MGALLLIDGDYGPRTHQAVIEARAALHLPPSATADAALLAAVAMVPDPLPSLTAAGVTFIAREEVTSRTLYERRYAWPTFPGGVSGITIGIGYDLSSVTPQQMERDFGEVVDREALTQLAACCAKRGTKASAAALSGICIPFRAAMDVFVRRSLPLFEQRARVIYPEIGMLEPARRTALVGLVYNRGTSLQDLGVDNRRREMREIQKLLKARQFDAVADQFDDMARLWDPAKMPGLIQRRHREAVLWRSGFESLQLA